MCLLSPQADQPHAVIEVQQLLVVELVDGHAGEEIAGVSKQTPTPAVAADAASYAPSAATAVVPADGAKQDHHERRVDASVERAAERQLEPLQRRARAAERRRAPLHRQRPGLRLHVVVRAGPVIQQPADKAESDCERAAGSAPERSG